MLLFASFLSMSTSTDQRTALDIHEGIQKCLASARQTIDVIYEITTFFAHGMYKLHILVLSLYYDQV
jgi:hypothetical protein